MGGESHDIDVALSRPVANPRIKAPFIDASEDDELLNATKHGIIQMQAALLLENHPDVSFGSFANVAFVPYAQCALGDADELDARQRPR